MLWDCDCAFSKRRRKAPVARFCGPCNPLLASVVLAHRVMKGSLDHIKWHEKHIEEPFPANFMEKILGPEGHDGTIVQVSSEVME